MDGPYAIMEQPMKQMFNEAIKYATKKFYLDADIDIIILCKEMNSKNENYVQWMEECATKYKAKYFFGCWYSDIKKLFSPLLEKYNLRYFWCNQNEGFNTDRNITFYGATPNQLSIPGVTYFLSKYGNINKRIYLIGRWSWYSVVHNNIIRKHIIKTWPQYEKLIVYKYFEDIDGIDYSIYAKNIIDNNMSGALIITSLGGNRHFKFYDELSKYYAKVFPYDITLIKKSFNVLENVDKLVNNTKTANSIGLRKKLSKIYPLYCVGLTEHKFLQDYGELSYDIETGTNFTLDIIENNIYIRNPSDPDIIEDKKFLLYIKNKYKIPISNEMYGTFLGCLFFAKTLKHMVDNNKDVNDVNIYDIYKYTNINTVTGNHIMEKNNHTTRPFYYCRIKDNGKFEILYDSYKMISADPYANNIIFDDIDINANGLNKEYMFIV